MHNVFHLIRRLAEFEVRRTRIRNLVLTIGLAMLVFGVIAVQYGRAQATGRNSGAEEGSAQASAQSRDAQAPPSDEAQAPSAGEAEAPTVTGNGAAGTAQGGKAGANTPANKGDSQAPSPNDNASQGAGAHAPLAKTPAQNGESEPENIQEPNPYKDLPSLHDLYTQIPSSGGKLQRFGSDAFLFGTGNANELPMDLPVVRIMFSDREIAWS